MKKYSFIVVAALLAGFTSCNNKVEEPESADFAWYISDDFFANAMDLSKITNVCPDTIEMSDQICFVANSSDASSYVVWTGDSSHNFLERDLNSELASAEKNNVKYRASGLALTSKDAMGRYYKAYNYSQISPAGTPFEIYVTARNYDWEKEDFAEIKAGPKKIVVVDTQVDLWNPVDPYNKETSGKYDITIKVPRSSDPSSKNYNKYRFVTNTSTGAEGSYEIVAEKPGIVVTYPKGGDITRAVVIIHANNCRMFSSAGSMIVNEYGNYEWTVDLSQEQKITLASQSSSATSEETKDAYTKDYFFSAVEYAGE